MYNLNKDLLFEIFKFLPLIDYPNTCLSCKSFNEYIKQDQIWKYKCSQECLDFYVKNKMDHYECYKLFHQLTKIKIKLNLKESIDVILNLKELKLSNNQTKEIPKELEKLQNLKYLYLQVNKIKKIPKELGNLQNLKYLYLYNNLIENIPKELNNSLNLKRLYLDNNQIKEIPKESGNLQNLHYFVNL